ncbi:MAG TPA: hypothetical protein VNO30_10550 [Kofleriaceae bacterium]|nr:hypothetical protein [Kofleriaceae bacterium]
MFKFSVRGQRVGRIVFGVVLLAGVGVLTHRLATARAPWVALVIVATWAAAFAAYAIAGRLGARRALAHEGELRAASLILPSVGAALLLPLTLHLPFAFALTRDLRDFDGWAELSMFLTGPTHLALAALVACRAWQLARGSRPIRTTAIFLICVAVSCVPFGIYVLPPILVAITGAPIAGLIELSESLAERDRVKGGVEALPHAIAVRRA